MHVIYVDVYFAINFLMDFIILVVAKQILNFKGKIEVRTAIRCVIAALFGATYSVIILVLKVKYGVLQILFTWLVVPYIMTGIAFNNRKLSGIKMLNVVYCVTFVLNGVVSMLSSYSFWGKTVAQAKTQEHKKLNVLMLMFGIVIGCLLMKVAVYQMLNKLKIRKNLYNVRIVNGDSKIETVALEDTGNSLREPYKGRPVSVLQYNVIKQILTGNEKCFLIPFKSVGSQNGILMGITVDYMEIKNRDDFLVFLKEFITEIHTEDFENNTLDSFLEAMKNWIEDMDGYYKNIGMREYNDKTLNWSMLADILNASRIYE